MSEHFSPAAFAAHTGLAISTLHYYERIGLLDPVMRLANGHRRYTTRDAVRIDFLKRLRATGMRIEEMLHYVQLFRQGDETLHARIEMLAAHRQQVLQQLDALQGTLDLLDTKLARYRAQVATAPARP